MRCLIVFSVLAMSAVAQTVGGGKEVIFEWVGAPPVAWDGNELGASVAGVGDVDLDGFEDFVVGAPGVDGVAGLAAGSAILYSGFDRSVIYQWFGATAFEYFGTTVASAGDLNGDGWPDIAVGCPLADPGGKVDAGRVYIYSGLNGFPMQIWDGVSAGDQFGYAIASGDDLDSDGWNDLIVGARHATNSLGQSFAGAAYVKSGLGGAVLQKWSGGAGQDLLGSSVAGAGDVNGDGVPDYLVGAPYTDSGLYASAGAAYVFSGADGSILHQWTAAEDAQLGETVAAVGDLDLDGFDDVAVGAPFADSLSAVDAGSVTFYSGKTGAILFQGFGWSAHAEYGSRIASGADFDGDGVQDVAVSQLGSSTPEVFIVSGATGLDLELHTGVYALGLGWVDSNGDGLGELLMGDPSFNDGGLHPSVGRAEVWGFSTRLSSSSETVSVATGGTLDFFVNFDGWIPGVTYKILLSASGTGPTPVDLTVVPLTIDTMLIDSYFGNYQVPVHSGMQGVLGASNDAGASLTIPVGLSPVLVGLQVHFAAILLGQNGTILESSVAQKLTLTP